MRKKIASLLMAVALCAGLLAGCTQNAGGSSAPAPASGPDAVSSATSSSKPAPASPAASSEPAAEAVEVRVAALKGPTTMGMVGLIDSAEKGTAKNKYSFAIGTTDETVPKLAKSEVDIAALPANLAATIHNNTNGAYQVAAINTLGVLYVVEKGESVKAVEDLKGRTVYSIGKGATPEYAVNYVLAQNGLDPAKDLTIEYKSEAAEIIPLLAQSENGAAVLQQPFVTTALDKVPGLRVALDWTKEWDQAAAGESALVTGVVVVRTAFAQEHPEAVKAFLEEYAASTEFVNAKPAEAAPLIEKQGIVAAAVAEKAIPACNIVSITGEDMKAQLSGYLQVLFDQNPQSVGGKLPGEEFYYLG